MIEWAYRSSYYRYELEDAGAAQSYISGFWLTEGEDDDLFMRLMDDAETAGAKISQYDAPFTIEWMRKRIRQGLERQKELEEKRIKEEAEERKERLLRMIEIRCLEGIIAMEDETREYVPYAHEAAYYDFVLPKRAGDALSVPRKLNRKLEQLIKDI